jgi:hypothetical protein
MRYIISEKQGITTIEVIGYNIFFGYDQSDDYIQFRNCLAIKGIDAFIDLLIIDHNTAFVNFCSN